jgi:SAM-dependent methyltransferase
MKGHRWYAATYDFINQWGEAQLFRPMRHTLLSDATGRVLEIGVGTGANIAYYPLAAQVIATEPDPFMLPRAKRRTTALGRSLPLIQYRAEALLDLPRFGGRVTATPRWSG